MSVRSKPKRKDEALAKEERGESELPEGWVKVGFMELFDIQGGTQPPKSSFVYKPTDGYVRLLQIRDFGEKPVPTYIPQKASLKTCVADDVLIGRYGASVGRICTGMEGAYNVALTKVIIPNDIEQRFAFFLLNSAEFQSPLLEIERSAQDGFNKDDLAEIHLPIAPLAEQRRIVGKLELLLGKVSSSRQRLSRVPDLLERFRQSVLAAACSGKLTADWREQNPDTEAAAASLAKCASSVDHKAIRHLVRRGTDGLPHVEPPAVPETWATCSVRQLVETGAVLDFQDGNHGSLYPRSSEFGDVGVKFLTAQQVFNNHVLLNETPLLNTQKAKLLRIGFAKPRDVLLTHNATVGRVAILPEYDGDVILGTSVTYYRTNTNALLPEFLCYEMQGQYWQDQLRSVMEQTTRDQVSVTKQVEFKILVPPLSEQQEIVRRVEKLFAFADQIEARLRQAQAHVDRLTQSLLGKAFRGELVPTEAELARRENRSYEPASELLARIQAEKTAPSQPSSSKRAKRSESTKSTSNKKRAASRK